jgi:DNA-directed RNA polymerase specialized sigma24 family protein
VLLDAVWRAEGKLPLEINVPVLPVPFLAFGREAEVTVRSQECTIPKMPTSNFLSTHWSIVLRAGRADDSDARDALAFLCQRYWYPLYVFARKKGLTPEGAEDLTQGFFTRLIETQVLEQAVPSRGRFRTFLLTSLQNFLANECDQAAAQKRGGGRPLLSLDVEAGESKLRFEPSHDRTPEKIFDRAWAIQLLELVVGRLRQEFADKGKAAEFDALQSFLAGKHADASYERTAAALGLSAAAVRQSAHRLRKRYRELLRAEVAETVAAENEIDDEIRGLFEALAP